MCQAEGALRARDEVGWLLRPSMPTHTAPWPVAVRILVVLLFCLTAGCAIALVITSVLASGDFDCDTKVLAAVNSATFVPELQVSDERYVIAYGRCTLDLSYSIRGVEHQSNFTTSCDSCQDLYDKQGQPAICFQSTQAIPEPQILGGPDGAYYTSSVLQRNLRIAEITLGAGTGVLLLLLALSCMPCVHENAKRLVAVWDKRRTVAIRDVK